MQPVVANGVGSSGVSAKLDCTAVRELAAAPLVGVVPLAEPYLAGREAEYIKKSLDDNWVSSVGPFVDRFEKVVAAYTGAKFGVATASGTAALHIALLVAGIEPGDEVLVSDLSFIAPANAIRYCGAWPIFIDAEPTYWQMDPNRVEDFLEKRCRWTRGRLINRRTGCRVAAVVPVHILGHPCDMGAVGALARRFGLRMIEDATESLGARYRGRNIGTLGDIACFSFNGNKLVTTGGGGMIVTNRMRWAERAKYLTTQAKDDPIEYVHRAIGFNYRLGNIQAAMGCAQFERIDEFLAAKRRIAARYTEGLSGLTGVRLMAEAEWATSAFWMYTIVVDRRRFGSGSRRLLAHLHRQRIMSRPLWQPLHRAQPHRGHFAARFPVADALYRTALSLPSSVGLDAANQDRVISAVRNAQQAA